MASIKDFAITIAAVVIGVAIVIPFAKPIIDKITSLTK